jgi:hypothetical protein
MAGAGLGLKLPVNSGLVFETAAPSGAAKTIAGQRRKILRCTESQTEGVSVEYQ